MAVDRRTAMLGGAALALAGCTRAGTPRASTVPAPLTPADFSLVIDGLDHAEGVASAPTAACSCLLYTSPSPRDS